MTDAMQDRGTTSPFLNLPFEIRLQIYEELFLSTAVSSISTNAAATTDWFDYKTKTAGGTSIAPKTLAFRTHTKDSEPLIACAPEGQPFASTSPPRRRSIYKIRDRFRARCLDATYTCVNTPVGLDANILAVSKQIYLEAAPILYTNYTFDFDSNIEACVSFLRDLTPYARSCIRRLSIVKRALPYDKDFDRCEWTSMCAYLSSHLCLTSLSLGIVSGMPTSGWDDVDPLSESMYDTLVHYGKRDELQWVRDLLTIKGLIDLRVWSVVEHCPPPGSEAMRFFVDFSASVEGGFSAFLKNRMVS